MGSPHKAKPQVICLNLDLKLAILIHKNINHNKLGIRIIYLPSLNSPDSSYFSGGLGIHSEGDLFSLVGAPDMYSCCTSATLLSSSFT